MKTGPLVDINAECTVPTTMSLGQSRTLAMGYFAGASLAGNSYKIFRKLGYNLKECTHTDDIAHCIIFIRRIGRNSHVGGSSARAFVSPAAPEAASAGASAEVSARALAEAPADSILETTPALKGVNWDQAIRLWETKIWCDRTVGLTKHLRGGLESVCPAAVCKSEIL